MKCNELILEAFASLGSLESLPSRGTLEALETFVVEVYGSNRPHHIQSLPQLRWYLYSKFQTEAEKLLPTISALKYKIFRCHFITIILKRLHVPLQNLPSPENYGWDKENACLVPIMTDSLPAPLALIELNLCGCKTCSTNRCQCRKNGFTCTDMCKCTDCENTEEKDGDELDEDFE